MSLNIWTSDDIRNVLLAANAASADVARLAAAGLADNGEEAGGLAPYRAGYEAALVTVATAFGIPLVAGGRLRSPGVAIPGGRLAVSYRAEQTMAHLLAMREEMEP